MIELSAWHELRINQIRSLHLFELNLCFFVNCNYYLICKWWSYLEKIVASSACLKKKNSKKSRPRLSLCWTMPICPNYLAIARSSIRHPHLLLSAGTGSSNVLKECQVSYSSLTFILLSPTSPLEASARPLPSATSLLQATSSSSRLRYATWSSSEQRRW
jgi:hypothetical protein